MSRDATAGQPFPDLTWHWALLKDLTALQVHAMLQLRQDVFLLEQRCFYRDADDLDLHSWHGLASLPVGDLVACARVVSPRNGFDGPAIGRVVVASAWRAAGLGNVLMQQAIGQARLQYPRQSLYLSAQAHLEHFYARFGFRRVSDVYDDEGIPHCDMRLAELR